MAAAYLIDGYNLIHALGILQKTNAPRELERSRHRLLEFLETHRAGLPGEVTVIFDAQRKPGRVLAEQKLGSIHVMFAVRQEADDVIEDLIARDAQPRRLRVVSDDRRIKQAAQRAGALALGTQDFLEHLDKRTPTAAAEDEEKPSGADAKEVERWLQEFPDLHLPDENRDFRKTPKLDE